MDLIVGRANGGSRAVVLAVYFSTTLSETTSARLEDADAETSFFILGLWFSVSTSSWMKMDGNIVGFLAFTHNDACGVESHRDTH